MKRTDPLDRLLRAAAQAAAPAADLLSPALEARVLDTRRQLLAGLRLSGEGASLLPIYHRGLALACGFMILALSLTLLQNRPREGSPWTDPVATVTRVYSP